MIVTEIQSFQGSALRELKRNGLVKKIVRKIEVSQIEKLTY